MATDKSALSQAIEQVGSKLPRLTRKQAVCLAAGGLLCATACYVWSTLNDEPIPRVVLQQNQQVSGFTSNGDNATFVPVLARDDAEVTVSFDLKSAWESLPDPNEFLELERKRLPSLLRHFGDLVAEMDKIIADNRTEPIDTDAEHLCLASRKAVMILWIAFQREHKDVREMSAQLLQRYERAEPLLSQCSCKLCSRMANSVRSRRKYVAAIVRNGPAYVTKKHFRALAAEP